MTSLQSHTTASVLLFLSRRSTAYHGHPRSRFTLLLALCLQYSKVYRGKDWRFRNWWNGSSGCLTWALFQQRATTEGFNDWEERGYDDFVPGEATKTAPSEDTTTWPPIWSVRLPRIHPIWPVPFIWWRLTPHRMPPLRMSSGGDVAVRACDGWTLYGWQVEKVLFNVSWTLPGKSHHVLCWS